MKEKDVRLLSLAAVACSITSIACGQTTGGTNPWGTPCEASGNLYGTTVNGGFNNYGILWKYAENSGLYSVVHVFDNDPVNSPEGTHPYARLLPASDGFLYGTTTSAYGSFAGGQTPVGTVFRINANGGGFTTVCGFPSDQSLGSSPDSGLIEDPVQDGSGNHVFYGVTAYGGANGSGVIYSLTVGGGGGGNITKLYDFPSYTTQGSLTYNTVGAEPRCELVLQTVGSTRYLFGTAAQGGTRGAGTVFSLRWPGATAFPTASTVTMNVEVAEGPPGLLTPWGGLFLYSQGAGGMLGKMYGATVSSSGVSGSGNSGWGGFYSLDNGSYTEYPILNTAETMPTGNEAGVFGNVGLNPRFSTPCLANDGYMYGTSELGPHQSNAGFPPRAANNGSVYRMNSAGAFQVVAWFGADLNPSLGVQPHTGLIQASDGYLYGVTSGFQGFFGNTHTGTDTGALYRLPTGTRGTITSVHRF